MEGMYPNLQEKFKNEGICPICMMTMSHSSKYSCANEHTMCHRCKPYYFACPTCSAPLDLEISPPERGDYHMPPAMHFMPHPYPQYSQGSHPSAPLIEEERNSSWAPPAPTADQELKHCGFCFAGCEARFPEHLRQIHESRCQFRPNLENEHLPTDLAHDEDILIDCRYREVGCNVRLPEWRKGIHETICIYKDRLESLNGVTECLDNLSFDREVSDCDYDPEEMVGCRYERYGCMVKVPRRRKSIHEMKCNWSKHHVEDEEENQCYVPDEDPDRQVPCIWAEYGCRVTPRICRKPTHEEKCNYRRERCSYSYNGCDAMFEPSRKYAHERNCEYA